MNSKEFIDSLFEGYEETAALADFKEELLGNLNAKIENLMKKGMDRAAAFEKASAELGDVSALADELSLKKRKEVFEEVYMDMRTYMSPKRVGAYIAFSAITLFGIITGCIVFFATRGILDIELNLISAFGTLLPFITAGVAGFTFLGLTQETTAAYPVSPKRAAWYTLAAALIAFGLLTIPLTYFSTKIDGNNFEVMTSISLLIPFVLPGGGLLAFMILTEKDRLKPWAKDFRNRAVKREMEMWADSPTAARFGMFCGAIWIFALALFILLGFLIGFKYSWLVFIFAIAIQLLVQGMMSKSEVKTRS